MSPIAYGALAGLVFGTVSVGMMLPMRLENRTIAYLGAFTGRFAVGFLVPLVALPLPMWGTGAVVGLLISISNAIVAGAYTPIILIGTVGGALIGLIGGFVVA